VVPWGIRKFLNWVRTEYNNVPVFVTESGYADKGELQDDGRVDLYNVSKHELFRLRSVEFGQGCSIPCSQLGTEEMSYLSIRIRLSTYLYANYGHLKIKLFPKRPKNFGEQWS